MTLDHISLAEAAIASFAKNKDITSVTGIQEVGSRNPKATFTVIGDNGAVLQVEIKRLMRGQPAPEPEPKKKPKAKALNAKQKGSK